MKFNDVATATLDQLTDELAAAGIASNFTDVDYARGAVYHLLAEMGDGQAVDEYKFATDSETGTITAANFDAACRQLDAMIEGSDGGFGWVEDVDGSRYEIEA